MKPTIGQETKPLQYLPSMGATDLSDGRSMLPSDKRLLPDRAGDDPVIDLRSVSDKEQGANTVDLSRLEIEASNRLLRLEAESIGYKEGFAAATSALEEAKVKNAQCVVSSMQALAKETADQQRTLQSKIVDLSVRIAEKILVHEAKIDPLFLAAAVRQALDNGSGLANVILFVAASDYLSWLNLFANTDPGESVKTVEIDPTYASGMCRIQSGRGTMEFAAKAQLAEVHQRFDEVLKDNSEPPTKDNPIS